MLPRYRSHDPSFRGAVELGQDETGEAERRVKRAHLPQRVLARVGIEDEERLVGRGGVDLADDPLDFANFFHQVSLGREAARRVCEHDIDAPRLRRADRVEHHRGGVPAVLRDHGHSVSLSPDRELLACGRPERVARGQQHRMPLRLQNLRELADRGRLAGSVHAGDHDHKGPRGRNDHGPFERREKLDQRGLQHRLRFASPSRPLPARTKIVDQHLRCGDADVGGKERSLDRLQRLVVQRRPPERRRKRAAPFVARAGETFLEALAPRLAGCRVVALEEVEHRWESCRSAGMRTARASLLNE